MFTIIPIIIIALSIAGILYIMTRKSRLLPHDAEGGLVYPDFEDRARPDAGQAELRDTTEAATRSFFLFTEKLIRRMQVRLMRIENWLASLTSRLQEKRRRKRKENQESEGSGASFISLQTQEGKSDEQYWLGVINEEPQSPYPYKKLGEIYIAREDFREARAVFRHALRLDPLDKVIQGKMEELRGRKTKKK